MKYKQKKNRLEARILDYEKMIKDLRNPESFTKPGSLSK